MMDTVMHIENGGGDANVSSTKLMVNYIPELMTRDTMYSLFSAIGKIDSCKLIANRGYGFIEYANHEDAERARASFNGLVMQGKTLKVSFALLNPETKALNRPDTDSNLYISNLPPDMTLENLNSLFRTYGQITNSRVSQGIAFVCFESRSQAEHAIENLNGYSPANGAGPITVKFANKPSAARPPRAPGLLSPHIPAAAPPFNLASHAGFNGTNFSTAVSLTARPLQYSPGYPQASPPPLLPSPGKALPFVTKGQQRFNPMAATNHAGHTALSLLQPTQLLATQHNTVYVYNIGEETDELTLWQLFGPYGAIDSIKVIKDAETKKNKGFAFVNMREYDEAANAIRMLNGFQLNGQVLSVSFKTQKRK